ncbi:MAG TPA: WecB/TagA/CpsF family glycosyltransferase, partial [Gemmatimonadales bacterium]
VTIAEAVNQIMASVESGSPLRVAFVNADCANRAVHDPRYRRAVDTADLVLLDGIGMRIAGWALGRPVRANVNGTDLFPQLCAALSARWGRLFLLGAAPGVAERVSAWVARHFPGVTVVGHQHGFFSEAEAGQVLATIREARPDVLLVAMGVPRQDVWLAHNLAACGATVGIGVGGLFDFYSGRIPRAPLWMRRAGLEWVYRLYQEPRRMWRRYLIGNVVFLARVAGSWWRQSSSIVSQCPRASRVPMAMPSSSPTE